MKVAVIGAGIGGLLAIKYCREAGLDVDCFEQTSTIGGTWVYSENTGLDTNGLPIHSSMYRNLLTNLPKELMGFQNYPFTGPQVSYVTPTDVMEFLRRYMKQFRLRQFIKFEHFVTSVSPMDDKKWMVDATNLVTKEKISGVYDAVFVCNGHFSVPSIPEVKGIEYFKGNVMHSHDYRYPDSFEGKRVLTVGAGPSGTDITMDLSTKASHVAFSHHVPIKNDYPENVEHKPDIAQVLDDGSVHFFDGSTEDFDVILFCTGYKYTFPFLSTECQIKVDDNHVTTLYKHIININNPTMFIIGIPFTTIITLLLDLQVRFSVKLLSERKFMPTKEQMMEDFDRDFYQRKMKGVINRKMHQLGGERFRAYYESLANIAEIEAIKPVFLDLFERTSYIRANDRKNYRTYRYQILDDFNFVETR